MLKRIADVLRAPWGLILSIVGVVAILLSEAIYSGTTITLQALSGVVLLAVGIWLTRKIWPNIEIRVSPTAIDNGGNVVILRLEYINRSRVLTKPSSAAIQIFEHKLNSDAPREPPFLPDFIPFKEEFFECYRRDCGGPTIEWHEPHKLTPPKKLEPGETVTVETVYQPSACNALHLGFQIKFKPSLLARLLHKCTPERGEEPLQGDSVTTTRWMLLARDTNDTA